VKHPASPQLQLLLVRAAQQHGSGDLHAAESSYRAALELEADQAMALAGLGALEGQRGHAAQAAQYLARACELEPQMAIFQHNHGEALRQLGQLAQAEVALRRAVELDQGLVPAWGSLIAMTQMAHGQALGARDTRRAELLATELSRLANNKGNAWLARGDLAQAIGAYRQALSIRPDYPLAWSNLGNALRQTGQINEAEAACRRAIALDPDFAAAWNNLGNALIEQGRYQEGTPCYEQALAKQADFPEALHNRGSGSLFNRLYEPSVGDAELAAVHAAWGASYPAPRDRSWNNTREPDRVLRVAYLSPDFREHAMQHFIEPLLACHRASNVEVVCYAQGPGADQHTRRLIAYGHRWEWVHGLSDGELAARIEHDRIDILVDCAGHTRGTRLAALAGKPAPILVGWLGYMHATGLPAMDYRLTDVWVDPPSQYSPSKCDNPAPEAPLRIPGGMLAYRPHSEAPDVNPLPCLARGYTTFGSLNNIQKLNRGVIADWAHLLAAVPQSRLLLHSKLLVDPGVVGRVRGMFEAFGIAPARLDLRPASADFLRIYHEIDIALDTLPYGGCTTTCDALWMGVPVITQSGTRAVGRLSTGLLNMVGHPEWVTRTSKDYMVAAVELARNTTALAQIRSDLRAQVQASPLCDETGFVQRLEEVYRTIWRRWVGSAR
jgi:protein O-GlcNAc transferase